MADSDGVRRPLLLAAALAALVPLLHVWPGEDWGSAYLRRHAGDEPVDAWTFFDVIATPLTAPISVSLAGWFIWHAWSGREAVVVMVASAAVIPNAVLRQVYGASPTHAELNTEPDLVPSYPSGHTAYAAAFFGAIAVLAWRRRRWDIAAVFGVLAALMGPARILDGVHLPVDILAGYAFGVAWLLLVVGISDSRGRIAD